MRKLISVLSLLVFVFGTSAQSFKKGDMVLDLGVGMGLVNVSNDYYDSRDALKSSDQDKITFTQKLGFEVCAHEFNDKWSLGVGFSFDNSTLGTHKKYVSGAYDYSYSVITYSKPYGSNRWSKTFDTRKRQGSGNALAKTTIIDYNVMGKVAFHRSFGEHWDTYAALGMGVAYVKSLYSDYTNTSGFGKYTQTFNGTGTYGSSYSYNDLEHVVWEQGSSAQGRFVIAGYIGARYFITSHFGIEAEAGLTSLSLQKVKSDKKDKWYNDYSLVNVGAVFKF